MKVNRVAVIGAGTMGHGIAQVFALAGLHVALTDNDAEVLGTAIERIQANLKTCVEHGFVSEDLAAAVPERIIPASDLAEAASQADFIVEAVFENLDVKREVLRQLEEHCPTHATIVSTTSSFRVRDMAVALSRPQRFLALAIQTYLLPELDRSTEPKPLIRDKVARGELGAKAGRGFYEWPPGRAEEAIRRRDEALLEMVQWLRDRGFLQTRSTTLQKFVPSFLLGLDLSPAPGAPLMALNRRRTKVRREQKSGTDLRKAVLRVSETLRSSFRGRPILPGNVEGEALVTHTGFNAYASFSTSIHTPVESALCADSSNPELYGKNLTDKILCLPKTIGSTSAGAVWQRVAQMGIAPKAMLFSKKIDSLAAGGLIVADVWAGKRIVTVDQLGDEFLETVKDGDRVVIREDGPVTIQC